MHSLGCQSCSRTTAGRGSPSLPTGSGDSGPKRPCGVTVRARRTSRESHRQVFGSSSSAAACRGRARGERTALCVGKLSSFRRQTLRRMALTRNSIASRPRSAGRDSTGSGAFGQGKRMLPGEPGKAGAPPTDSSAPRIHASAGCDDGHSGKSLASADGLFETRLHGSSVP
jgi:hypothetical protein